MRAILLATLIVLAATLPARAEVLEEIVAWVNGEIVTSSEMEIDEQAMVAEAYRRFSGEELDRQVEIARSRLLLDMVDRKILYTKATQMYDVEKMADFFYESFKEQQNITSDEALQVLLDQEGLTADELRQRLVETFAPDEVIRFEVSGRVSVSDREVEEYYLANGHDFVVPAEATVREIVLLANTDARKSERRAEADATLERVQSGEDFATVAKEVSEAGTSAEGGALGPLKPGDLSFELGEVAFGLPVGEVSDLLVLPYGFHILKIESREESRVVPLDEVSDRLRLFLENRKHDDELLVFLEKAREEAEWCVKPKYANRLPEPYANKTCEGL